MFDDLQQLFGYQGAIDERSGVTIVGPDLLVVPCWTAEFCATLVRAAEAIGAFEPHPDDPVPGHEVSLAVISPRLFETVQEDFGTRIWPQLQIGLAVRRLLRPPRCLRHPVRAARAGITANSSRCRPDLRVDQAQRRVFRCRPGLPASAFRQLWRRCRRDAGVAVARHPPTRNRATRRRNQVRVDSVVRVAVVLRHSSTKIRFG